MKINSLILLFLSFSVLGQEVDDSRRSDFSFSHIGIETNTLLSSSRLVSLPNEVISSDFYQINFEEFGIPEREIRIKNIGTQIGINMGVSYQRLSFLNIELTGSLGYQNNREYEDIVRKFSNLLTQEIASIKMNYRFHEFYFSSALLLKTNSPKTNFYTGFGVNSVYSNPTTEVIESENNLKVNSYYIKDSFRNYVNFFVPVGLEFALSENLTKGFKFRFDYSLRWENYTYNYQQTQFFSSIGISLIYRL